jgi:hypothetical protein
MINSVKGIINCCNKDVSNGYNILTFPTHERYESQLAKTGHNFYSFNIKNGKKWNKEQIDTPKNYHILPEGYICEYIPYDFILVQSKFWQYQAAQQINQTLMLPIIVLEHTLPTPQTISEQNIQIMKKMGKKFPDDTVENVKLALDDYKNNAGPYLYIKALQELLKTNVINAKLNPLSCACPDGIPNLSKSTICLFVIAISKIREFLSGRGSLIIFLIILA